MSAAFRGVSVGAGYFSQFHYDAWARISDADLVALCDRDQSRAEAVAREFGVPKTYADVASMLDAEQPDFIDIITPPETHQSIVGLAAERGVHVLCQKALAPTFADAAAIVENAESPRKARRPVTISYSTDPKLKTSERPSTARPSACSGDM